jgi:hypothetical protein
MGMVNSDGSRINRERCLRLIHQAIETFGLDLSDLIVLTEAATGYYVLTPLIAALAGAGHVYALTRDSRYGSAAAVRECTLSLAAEWQVAGHLTVLSSRRDERVGWADVVTNLGFVRPLDRAFLARLKPTAAIPLMYETWEYRPEDLDLDACRQLGIPVLGTNERHKDLQFFRYVGLLALKLLSELEIEVFRSRVVVLGGGEFGDQVTAALQAVGAEVTQVCVEGRELFRDLRTRQALTTCDAVVVAEHRSREMLIAPGGCVAAAQLRQFNPGICVAHIAGGVDPGSLEAAGIPYRPRRLASVGHMSVTTDYLGPRPLIDLHTAGLVVGQHLARARLGGALPDEAESLVLSTCRLAQGFSCNLHDGGVHGRQG